MKLPPFSGSSRIEQGWLPLEGDGFFLLRGTRLELKWLIFHTANPLVYRYLCRFAREWRAMHPGMQCGIGALYERVRWEIRMQTQDPNFKVNNNFRAYYAREIMAKEPDLAGLFETRRLTSI